MQRGLPVSQGWRAGTCNITRLRNCPPVTEPYYIAIIVDDTASISCIDLPALGIAAWCAVGQNNTTPARWKSSCDLAT
jgi:hypothetical protein